MSSSPWQPLAGRRIWLAGIGGAGMSGYALLAHAWGAEVAGWDRVDTPYLRHLEGIVVEISPEPPTPPAGWEAFVSTAFAGRVEGRPRADLLAELVAQRQTIVVAGAHGKTTTSAMIAFCLDRLGLDPAFLIGGEMPQLGGNARAGAGWLVVEGDESDRSVAALRPEIAVLLNVDLDHHTTFGSRAEVELFFEEWLRDVPHVVRAEELEPVQLDLAVPGEHNRRNAAAALAALELAGVAASRGRGARSSSSAVPDADSSRKGRRAASPSSTATRTIPRSSRPISRPCATAAGCSRCSSRTSTRGRFISCTGSQRRSPARTPSCVTEIYPAREEPLPGVTGRLIVDELASIRPGMRIGWGPSLEDAATLVAGWARPGDTVLTLGAGDVDRAASLILEALA